MSHPAISEEETNWIGEILPVKVTNIKDITLTIEHEPEHFVCQTFVLIGAGNTASGNNSIAVIGLDQTRKGVTILPIDNPVVVCHNQADAQNPANQVAAPVAQPQGAYLPTGTPLSVEGSGPLWIVSTVPATANRVSVVQTRRGNA